MADERAASRSMTSSETVPGSLRIDCAPARSRDLRAMLRSAASRSSAKMFLPTRCRRARDVCGRCVRALPSTCTVRTAKRGLVRDVAPAPHAHAERRGDVTTTHAARAAAAPARSATRAVAGALGGRAMRRGSARRHRGASSARMRSSGASMTRASAGVTRRLGRQRSRRALVRGRPALMRASPSLRAAP